VYAFYWLSWWTMALAILTGEAFRAQLAQDPLGLALAALWCAAFYGLVLAFRWSF